MALEWLYSMRRPQDEHSAPSVLVRRTAAIVALTAFPLTQLLFDADIEILPGLGDVPYVIIALTVLVAWIASVAIIYEFRRRLAQARDDQLDEREQRVRDEAYLISYRILGGLTLVLWFAALAIVPMFLDSREISLDLALDAFSSLFIVCVVLPSAVVAWRDTESGELDDPDDPLPGSPDPVSGEAR